MWRRLAASPAARRPTSRRAVSYVPSGPWRWEFRVQEQTLRAEYDLPAELAVEKALEDFFSPLHEHVKGGPTPLLGDSGTSSLRNSARALSFLDDLKQRTEQLVEERRVMEAVALLTTRWSLVAGGGHELLHIGALRSFRDRAPAFGAVTAGLLGPLAWIPGVLVCNEVIMRRVDAYGALVKDSPDRYEMAKAVMKHHILRALYDWPRAMQLEDCYEVQEGLGDVELQEAITRGEHRRCVAGRAEL
mmetsp:Transcript_85582/g.277166  ORF Transcript_85582/g.277166 Transcript_85582/m.277166 type:complete len:246 (-) Transcript_85582:102-839(-)